MQDSLTTDDRGRISYTDVVMTFATLAGILMISPQLYHVYDMITGTADPLTAALVALVVPILLIALMISMGVSARSG